MNIMFVKHLLYSKMIIKISALKKIEIDKIIAEESSLTGSVLPNGFRESAYAPLMILIYSSPNSSIIVSPIPVAYNNI